MDSDDLYDEFGNFLGDANDSDADSVQEGNADASIDNGDNNSEYNQDEHMIDSEDEGMEESSSSHTALVHSNSLEKRFPKVETVVVDPTFEGSDEPVIQPLREQTLRLEYKIIDNTNLPETVYSKQYLVDLPKSLPERIRNVAVVGHLHSGKTSIIDTFVAATHPEINISKRSDHQLKPVRYTDTHKLENERGISINAACVALLLPDSRDRSFAFNFVDCPGHPDFRDEVYSSLGAVEGVAFVVDVVEGLTAPDKRMMTEIIRRNLPLVIVLNKLDRLVLELRLPPQDASKKLRYVLSEINAHIYHNEYAAGYTQETLISPFKNNVVFASHKLSMSFTLETWARIYSENGDLKGLDEKRLKSLLWGEIYFEKGKFSKVPKSEKAPSTFEQFVLEPIYKLVSHTLVADAGDKKLPQLLWDQFGVSLNKSFYKEDPQTLLQEVFRSILGDTRDFVHSIISSINPPHGQDQLSKKGLRTGPADVVAEVFNMNLCSDTENFECLTKIHCGTLKVGDRVQVVGSNYPEDITDMRTETIGTILIPVGRYNMEVEAAYEGTIVILRGVGSCISKGATIFSKSVPVDDLMPIHRTENGQHSFYKVAVECENPAELPKLVRGLEKLSKCYISAQTKLEESGEHVLLGPGEMYLDSFLHDLRYYSADKYLSIRVSDPMVKFAETVGERSATKITTSTASKVHSLAITAEPVADKRLLAAIENGKVSLKSPKKVVSRILKDEFGWDALAARSIWTFGPRDMQNPSMLLDDTLEGETDKSALQDARELIVAGFNLAINEGPLCDEPVRRTKVKILDAVLGANVQNSGGQIIPMARSAVHTGILTAAPRLLEPVYRVHVTCTYRSVGAVHTILEKRRGWAVSEVPIVATRLYEIEGCVPIIDSVGLDTDMRLYTQGQAFCSLEFFRWDVVPGDPLDKLCDLPAMKPVPRASLARDFVLKTCKRKGLSGEPTLQKYVDADLYARLLKNGVVN